MNRFAWKWYLDELKVTKPVKVFSTFSCGGGSSMGYKRAGMEVIGNVEIDPKVNAMYCKNNHPKYNFCMDLRKFNELEDLPEELYHLDILDGSPPCTTFSTAGLREATWGKEKAFREGQAKQRLDDLFFVYLDTVAKLRPKVAIAENVVGLIKGNAKGYVSEIIARFKSLGYDVQLFKLNSAVMDVPQARERVFFIANNQGYGKLNLNFNYDLIPFGVVRSEHGSGRIKEGVLSNLLENIKDGDRTLKDVAKRTAGVDSYFGALLADDSRVMCTITSGGRFIRMFDKEGLSDSDFVSCSTFPQDYDFMGSSPQYACGMCVPPNMTANIATEVYEQWLK